MKVQFDSDEFQATYSQTCDLFAKYQMAIHKDSPGECGERQVRLLFNETLSVRAIISKKNVSAIKIY